MKKIGLLVLVLISLSEPVYSQTAVDSVKAVVNQLFIAMKSSDGTLLQSTFTDSAIMQTIGTSNEGNSMVKNQKVMDFAAMINKVPKGDVDERIEFDVVKVDGDLAIVWTPYRFYLKGEFRHCGVNSFQLVRQKEGWKIQYLIDTRRRTGCN